MKYMVYIPYVTYTEHEIEADNSKQAREIAMNEGNLDRELLNNLDVDGDYIEVSLLT